MQLVAYEHYSRWNPTTCDANCSVAGLQILNHSADVTLDRASARHHQFVSLTLAALFIYEALPMARDSALAVNGITAGK